MCTSINALISTLKAQKSITLDQVNEHIGDSVIVIGKTFSIRYLESSKGAPTLINMGAAFPNQQLTVVIYGENRNKFPEAPETLYANKDIFVTSVIELFKNKPQIVISSPSQIEFVVNRLR